MEAGSVAIDRTVLTNDGRIEVESNKIVESNQRIDRLVQDLIHYLIVLGSATTPEMEGRDGTRSGSEENMWKVVFSPLPLKQISSESGVEM